MSNSCLIWDEEDVYENSFCLLLIIPTFLAHILFWVHVCCYNFLHHWSLLWIYNYLLLDMISLTQVLLEYATRRLIGCNISSFWYDVLCSLEAYTNTYVTMAQSIALSLTIVYRYKFIVKNQPINFRSKYSLMGVQLFLYFFPMSILILESLFSASEINDVYGLSCDAEYALLSGQLVNSIVLVISPICINIIYVLLIILHVQKSQNTVRSIRRLHRRLLIQFVILFTIWFLFLVPQVAFMLSVSSSNLQRLITKLLDVGATASDVIVITLFDRRFLAAWSKTIKRLLKCFGNAEPRIGPTTRDAQQ